MGIEMKKTKPAPWSDEEIEVLRNNPMLSSREIAFKLPNRSPKAIEQRRYILKISVRASKRAEREARLADKAKSKPAIAKPKLPSQRYQAPVQYRSQFFMWQR